MYKFKTMSGIKIKKVTKFGKKLRLTGLDELPQLLNILKGDMSFIGPRPWIKEYYDSMNKEQKQRTILLPGITGYAQININQNTNIFQKINYDLEYINNVSFLFDLKILIKQFKNFFIHNRWDISEIEIQREIKDLQKFNLNNRGLK